MVGTNQSNFAIRDYLIMCLEARPAAESKIGLIMSYSERFISLKMFYSTKSALNICLLLDTINYFSATRML